jgi:hypothetical protein
VKCADIEIAEEQAIAPAAGAEMSRYYRTGEEQKYLFVLQESEDTRIEGVTIRNAPLWNVRLQDCARVWIRGIHLYSDLERPLGPSSSPEQPERSPRSPPSAPPLRQQPRRAADPRSELHLALSHRVHKTR